MLPILLCAAGAWSVAVAAGRRLDAFGRWCLRRVLRVPCAARVAGGARGWVVASAVVSVRLRLFGRVARAGPSRGRSRALRAAVGRLPAGWRRRGGRPRRAWLRAVESDLRPANLGLSSACLRAQDRSKWRSVVETAMLTAGRAT